MGAHHGCASSRVWGKIALEVVLLPACVCVWCGWVPGRGFAVHWNEYCSASGCNIHDSAYVVPGAWVFCMSVGVGSGRRGRGPSGLSFGYLPHRDAHNVHDNSSMHCGLRERKNCTGSQQLASAETTQALPWRENTRMAGGHVFAFSPLVEIMAGRSLRVSSGGTERSMNRDCMSVSVTV